MVMMLGICPLWVYAQSRLDSIQHLDEITVVAKSFREVIPSQKLSGKELQKLNSHSVADALRYFSGVQFRDGLRSGYETGSNCQRQLGRDCFRPGGES